jgi:hypothetical protein
MVSDCMNCLEIAAFGAGQLQNRTLWSSMQTPSREGGSGREWSGRSSPLETQESKAPEAQRNAEPLLYQELSQIAMFPSDPKIFVV